MPKLFVSCTLTNDPKNRPTDTVVDVSHTVLPGGTPTFLKAAIRPLSEPDPSNGFTGRSPHKL
jgi:hypothetical protein